MSAQQLAAALQMYRVLCHSPCRCDWTPIRNGQEAKEKCARCVALKEWERANPVRVVK
jgi:hypothetical protein